MARSGDKDSGEYWVFIAWGSEDSSVEARCFGVSKVELKRRGDRHSGSKVYNAGGLKDLQ